MALWSIAQSVASPAWVKAVATSLGLRVGEGESGEFHLLPFAVAVLHAPLPSGWQEVLRGGRLLFRDVANAKTHRSIRSSPARARRPRRNRGRVARGMMSPWERTGRGQFVDGGDEGGEPFFYSFASGAQLASTFERVRAHKLLKALRRHHGMAAVDERAVDGAAAAARAFSISDASVLLRRQRADERRRASVAYYKQLGQSLRASYKQVLAAALAHRPRPRGNTRGGGGVRDRREGGGPFDVAC